LLKEWECVQVGHHKDIRDVIMKWQEKGWNVHSYQTAYNGSGINHYLLLERGV
jgi:hypothetical protein